MIKPLFQVTKGNFLYYLSPTNESYFWYEDEWMLSGVSAPIDFDYAPKITKKRAMKQFPDAFKVKLPR